jgi:hypothetical protein
VGSSTGFSYRRDNPEVGLELFATHFTANVPVKLSVKEADVRVISQCRRDSRYEAWSRLGGDRRTT